MPRVLIVETSRVLAEVLARRLGEEPDISSVTAATDVGEAVALLRADAVDLIITQYDFALHLLDSGVVGTARGRPPWVLVLDERPDADAVATAIRWGAAGWVSPVESMEVLLKAIDAVAHGGTWIPPHLLTGVLTNLQWRAPPVSRREELLSRLTTRQAEVLRCLELGMGRREVAEHLHVSANTVRTHVEHILKRLDVRSALAAVALLRQHHGEAALGRTEPPPVT